MGCLLHWDIFLYILILAYITNAFYILCRGSDRMRMCIKRLIFESENLDFDEFKLSDIGFSACKVQ